MAFLFVCVDPDAVVPTRGSRCAAGYDLSASRDISIPPRCRAVVPTGVAMRVPEDCYGRIAPRSGLAVRHGVDVLAGVVDSDYTGEVKAVLINHGDETFSVRKGDRVAQLILERIYTPSFVVVDALYATERGTGGFGSTGIAPPAAP